MALGHIIEAIQKAQNNDECYKLWKKHKDEFLGILDSDSSCAPWRELADLVMVCLQKGHSDLDDFVMRILVSRDLIQWKHHPELLTEFMAEVAGCEASNNLPLLRVTETIMKISVNNRLMPLHVQSQAFDVLYRAIKGGDSHHPIHKAVEGVGWNYPWKEETEVNTLKMLTLIEKAVVLYPGMVEGRWLSSVKMVVRALLRNVRVRKMANVTEKVAQIFNFCRQQKMYAGSAKRCSSMTLVYSMCEYIMEEYIIRLKDASNEASMKPFMAGVKQFWDCSDPSLRRAAHNIMTSVAGSYDLVGEEADILIDMYLTGQENSLISAFVELYKQVPKKFHIRLDDFMSLLLDGEDCHRSSCYMLIWEIAKRAPQEFTKAHIDNIASLLQDSNLVYLTFSVLHSLAESRPRDVNPHGNDIIKAMRKLGGNGLGGGNLLVRLSSVSQEDAKKYCSFFAEYLDLTESHLKVSIIYYMRTIGHYFPEALEQQRPLLNKLRTDPLLKDSIQQCFDVIDGRSLETVLETVAASQQVLDDLGNRLITTQDNVHNLAMEVGDNRGSRSATMVGDNRMTHQQTGSQDPKSPPSPGPPLRSASAAGSNVPDLQLGPHLTSIEGVQDLVEQAWPLVKPMVAELIQQETEPLKTRIVSQDKEIRYLKRKLREVMERLGGGESMEIYL